MFSIAIVGLFVSFVYTVWSLVGLKRTIASKPILRSIDSPKISLLKPLYGSDDKLQENLCSFFEQDYSNYEIIFGVQDPKDSAIAIVKNLMALYPHIDVRLHIHPHRNSLNPKVSNLSGISKIATGSVLVISDSNVSVPPHYLASSIAHLNLAEVGLVTHVMRGLGEESLGALLNSVHMNGYTAPSVGLTNINNRPFVIGKSIMIRKGEFEKLGGFAALGNVLAEDYILGRTYLAAGYKIAVDNCVANDVNTHMSVRAFWKRNARWALIRSKLKPLAYPFEVFTYSIFMGALLSIISSSLLPLLLGVLITMFRDVVAWYLLRGPKGLLKVALVSPLKEVLLIGIWATAAFNRSVTWRDTKVYVSAGTRIYARPKTP